MLRVHLSLLLSILLNLLAIPVVAQDSVENPNVHIGFPPPVYVAVGILSITGTANISDMINYTLEYVPVAEFSSNFNISTVGGWLPIEDKKTSPVENGVLGVWDTTKMIDGLYALRLTVNTASRKAVNEVIWPIRILNQSAAIDSSIPTPVDKTQPLVTLTISAKSANVRTGDSTKYPVVNSVLKGTQATVIGISSTGSGWYKIKLENGKEGWISPSTVNVIGDTTTLVQIVPPQKPILPTAAPSVAETTSTTAPSTQNDSTIQPLKVLPACSPSQSIQQTFFIVNPNPFEVPVTYRLSTGDTAFVMARPNERTFIEIGVEAGITSITLTADWGSGTASATCNT